MLRNVKRIEVVSLETGSRLEPFYAKQEKYFDARRFLPLNFNLRQGEARKG